jgi:aminoglycoside phosphotransferase (APT) family kinase protein
VSEEGLGAAIERRLVDLGIRLDGISDLTLLTGGASRETWMFTVTEVGGSTRELVLRRDPPGAEDPDRMALEAAALAAAATVSVPVPVLLDCSSAALEEGLGSAYPVMERVAGEALPQRLLRDHRFDDVRARLPYEMGRVLARIHQMDIQALPGLTGGDQLERLFAQYCASGLALPLLEVAFNWLRARRPHSNRDTLVHGDFRNGNVLVDESGIQAVLDWELVHHGDPMEDLGWLCVKSWRFGAPGPVGGFGSREELFKGYAEESGVAPDPAVVHWWECYGTLRWAVMCRTQANRVLVDGNSNALELLAVGRRSAECEQDLSVMLGLANPPAESVHWPAQGDELFGRPTTAELLEAVKGFVRTQSSDADPRSRYLARVAGSVLDMAARESLLGEQLRREHRDAMAAVGVNSEAELAAALRAETRTPDDPAVVFAIRQAVAARLEVARPGY